MPNPYHDETGKFCSAGEMVAATGRLITENKIAAAETLLKEYNQIREDQNNTGLTPLDITNNNIVVKGGSVFAEQELKGIEPYIILTQQWDDNELEIIEETTVIKEKRHQKVLQELEEEHKKLVDGFKAEAGTDISSFLNESFNLKTDADDALKQVYEKAVAAGVPQSYANDYIYNRVAPAAGVKDGYDPYKRKVIYAASTLTPIDVSKLPGVRDVGRKTALNEAFREVFGEGVGKNWNERVSKNSSLLKKADLANRNVVQLKTKISEQRKLIEQQKKARLSLKNVKEWRKNMRSAGIPESAKLVNVAAVHSESIKVDETGKIVNAWGVKDGVAERIVSVKTVPGLGYSSNVAAGQLVGESGRTYFSSVHYANYTKYKTDAHVIVDSNSEGETLTEHNKQGYTFSYSIDSGD